MAMTRTALAAAWALALAAPATADDFCDALKHVVADAPKGFAATRGQPDPGYPASYWRPFLLPGATALMPDGSPCFVLHAAKTNPPEEYRCFFPGAADRDGLLADMHRMADRVSTCLSPMTFDQKQGLWRVAVDDVSVLVGGALPPPQGGAGVVAVMIVPKT